MVYEEIIKTISAIVGDDDVSKGGLRLVYEVDEIRHKQLDEELFIKMQGNLEGFEHQEVIEIEMGGVLMNFIKTGTKITYEDLDD